MTPRSNLRVVEGTGPEDPVTRRRRFETAHPDAVILPPSAGRWRAVADGRTLGSWDLEGLMDQLDEIYPDARRHASLTNPVPLRHDVPETGREGSGRD